MWALEVKKYGEFLCCFFSEIGHRLGSVRLHGRLCMIALFQIYLPSRNWK